MKESSYNMKPQDVVILFKILAWEGNDWNQSMLSAQLNISQSEISESIRRSKYSGLISTIDNSVNRNSFYEFIIYGLKYIFPQKPGSMTRGIPTAHSAPFLQHEFMSEDHFVWPSGKGHARGQAIVPLYHSVPGAAEMDPRLYEYLVLADVIRVGRVREKELAKELLKQKMLDA